MKKSLVKLLVAVATIIAITALSSCGKEDHHIRVKNDYSAQFLEIGIGELKFANVDAGATTAYKAINAGDFTITGRTTDNKVLSGSGNISGKGRHRWTLTTHATGITLREDK